MKKKRTDHLVMRPERQTKKNPLPNENALNYGENHLQHPIITPKNKPTALKAIIFF